ncbi:MAG: alpha/beta fold hydrolase [Planctomycetota bacterium]
MTGRLPHHRRVGPWGALALAALLAAPAGCATKEQWIQRRPTDAPLAARFFSGDDNEAPLSPATAQVAARVGIDPAAPSDRERLLALLKSAHAAEESPEVEFALAELAAVHADELSEGGDSDAALGFYAESLVHGYHALADDPLRRIGGATARYNGSLRSLLRLLKERDAVDPGAQIPLPSTDAACAIAVELHSKRWRREDFHQFEFAGDYQVLGLRNHYHTTGVGVPLVAMRMHPDRDHPEDRFYPRKLCYPLTAFMRVEEVKPTPAVPGAAGHRVGLRLVLELHDPMEHERLAIAGREVAMASDLTTPLAYFLDQPEFHDEGVSTNGLFMPGKVEPYRGLYLLEPYDPERMPVVMVHGLWSSPATWMEMFNDLRSDPRVRSRYQFWFYLYPTAKPFFVSGANMRSDLADLRRSFDPARSALPLDQTVLVGHSMGGLLSRMQAVDSGNDFWSVVANDEFSGLVADEVTRREMSQMFYFRPNKSVRRVVTIGSPHRGSNLANGVTRWLGSKLIALPVNSMARRQQVFRDNPQLFRPPAARMMTSIDSLSPDSPMLTALLGAKSAPWVSYHNVVGDKPRDGVSAWFASRGDGVVSLASARLDDLPGLESQVIVPESHVALHRHPQTVAEVQRVLLAQASELEQGPIVHTALPALVPASTPTRIRLSDSPRRDATQPVAMPFAAPRIR